MKHNLKYYTVVGLAIALFALAGCKHDSPKVAVTNGYIFSQGWWFISSRVPGLEDYRQANYYETDRSCSYFYQQMPDGKKTKVIRDIAKGDDLSDEHFDRYNNPTETSASDINFRKAVGGWFDIQFEAGWYKFDFISNNENTSVWYKFDANKERVEWRQIHEGKIYSSTEKVDDTDWDQFGVLSASIFVDGGILPIITKIDESEVPEPAVAP